MLVLSRKINQKIKIGDNIEITIVAINGDNIRIGIEAPENVKILRSEVYEEIQSQNNEALISSGIPQDFKKLIDSIKIK